ncbi:hypothetical protein SUDANB108_07116 [Streptomyces sp. enrichment culture]
MAARGPVSVLRPTLLRVTTTKGPLYPYGSFGDLMDAFFGGDGEITAGPLLDQLRDRAADINDALTVASRRVLLMDRHPVATRYFEDLAAEADTLRRITARVEALAPASAVRAQDGLFNEADACLIRFNRRVRAEGESPDLVQALRARLAANYRLTPQQFEHRTAQMFLLLEGCSVEQWGGGAGDLAADVIVRFPAPDGRRAIVQCKHTSDETTRIGSGVVQQVSGVRQVHGADLAFVVTTGGFTTPARDVARKLGVGLLDGGGYFGWTSLGYPLTDFETLASPAAR